MRGPSTHLSNARYNSSQCMLILINSDYNYHRRGSGALNNVGGISGVVAYSPSYLPREFLDNDYNLHRKCSIGEADTQYRTRRPPVTCAIYSPPRRSEC